MIYGAYNIDRFGLSYIGDDNIVDFFNGYTKSLEAFTCFCKDWFIWRVPNSEMLRFSYSPDTGEKINWDEVYLKYKSQIKRT